jgi:peptidoglycan/LPS O-acetylase OafA/YrhL
MIKNVERHSVQPLTPAGSILLDVARFAAASLVAFGHLTSPTFSSGWRYQLPLALDGVAVFFVLSGFVIRLVTRVRPVRAFDYTVDRASRIYSVVLPAIVLTLIVHFVLQIIPSANQLGNREADHLQFRQLMTQVAANLTFTAECWGLDIPVSFNSVFWSLSYECAYYAIYGVAVFGRGAWRVAGLVLLCFVLGPPILFLLPLWLVGCVMHDVYQQLRVRAGRLGHNQSGTGRGTLIVVGVSALLCVIGSIIFNLQDVTRPTFSRLSGLPIYVSMKSHHIHLLQRASLRFYVIGLQTAVVMLLLLLALERTKMSSDHWAADAVRRVADGTFSLYLFHLPLLFLAAAYIPYDHASSIQKLTLLSGVTAICLVTEPWLDRLKKWMRKVFSSPSLESPLSFKIGRVPLSPE